MIGAGLVVVTLLGLTIWLTRVKPPCKCPYIERVQGRWPLPPMPEEDRRAVWEAKYKHIPLEMQIAPVGRFTGGSPHASYGKTQESDGADSPDEAPDHNTTGE